MRFRITKQQVKMLINGKPLTNGRQKIYIDNEGIKQLKIINEKNLYGKIDLFLTDKGFVAENKK